MNAVDTNVLARFFINNADDHEAVRQRPAAIACGKYSQGLILYFYIFN